MELFKGQSLLEFTERFKTDLDCEEYLASIKWEKGYCAVNVDIQNTKSEKIFHVLVISVEILQSVLPFPKVNQYVAKQTPQKYIVGQAEGRAIQVVVKKRDKVEKLRTLKNQ